MADPFLAILEEPELADISSDVKKVFETSMRFRFLTLEEGLDDMRWS